MQKKQGKTQTKTIYDAVLADAQKQVHCIDRNPDAKAYIDAYIEAVRAGKIHRFGCRYLSACLKSRFDVTVGRDSLRRYLVARWPEAFDETK